MKYYRRKRYGDKRVRKIVLSVLFVLFAAAVITVLSSLLGHHLKNMVEKSEEASERLEHDSSLEQNGGTIGSDLILSDFTGEKISVFAAGIDPFDMDGLEDRLGDMKGKFDTVSVGVTENGKLIYTSPALLGYMRIPTDSPEWEGILESFGKMETLSSSVKAEGFRLSAVLEASSKESDRILIEELSSLGFDEVIITGFEKITAESVNYLLGVSGKGVSVGVLFPAEEYQKNENVKLVRALRTSGILLCAKLDEALVPSDDAVQGAKKLASRMRSTIEAYQVRIVIDSADLSYIAKAYEGLFESKIENIQITAPVSYEALTETLAERNPDGNGEGGAETAAPVNPYVTTAPAETAASDKNEEETTDGSASNPIWY